MGPGVGQVTFPGPASGEDEEVWKVSPQTMNLTQARLRDGAVVIFTGYLGTLPQGKVTGPLPETGSFFRSLLFCFHRAATHVS